MADERQAALKTVATATAVLVTGERDYASACYGAFRQRGLFPVIAATIEEATALLRQFKVDALVLHAFGDEAAGAATRCLPHLTGTTVIVVPELPTPHTLASRVRHAINRSHEPPSADQVTEAS